ncbi:MAG: HD domain-containing phosphohydrolase [Candidatus Baltobacteraceae bacterium]
MSLAEGSGSSSASESTALGELLAFFGTAGDYAAGTSPAEGARIASLAAAIGDIEGLSAEQSAALFFSALLRNSGAVGNPALAKGHDLSERSSAMALWDIPAHSARLCEKIAALPHDTADIVRWQSECWDGTGFPDQLRWTGIPKAAQILNIASAYVHAGEPEEALVAITAEAGRSFSPEQTRSFVTWYHTNGGEVAPVPVPHEALAASRTTPEDILELLSAAIDAHNATPGRSARIAETVRDILQAAGAPEEEIRDAAMAAQLFGAGELRAKRLEDDRFGPLARLGIELRSRNAVQAAELLSPCAWLRPAAAIVRARAEWFDGTGAPDGLRSKHIPAGAQALALAIAHDALEQSRRSKAAQERSLPMTLLETASGTQFDPAAVRALASIAKMHA